MSIAKPFTFVANTYAKASEVNADFDTVYSQVNTNISAIAQNATDIDNLENNKADINGNSSQRFAVADPVTNGDAVNKQTLLKSINNSIDLISGFIITKDSGSPDDTIIVSAGSCYDSTKTVVLSTNSSTTKQNQNQAANTQYYVYVIGNATGSSVDILISTTGLTPTLPAGYTVYRQIGRFTTDANKKIKSIFYYGENPNADKSQNGICSNIIPNYDAGVDITSGYTVPSYGYIIVNVGGANTGVASVSINGDVVSQGAGAAGYLANIGICSYVAPGDVITWVDFDGGGFTSKTRKFFPLKGV